MTPSAATPRREGKSAEARLRRSFLLAAASMLTATFSVAGTYNVAGFSDTAVVLGLSAPTAITWTTDGRMLILEKVGRVRIVVNGVLLPTAALDLSANVDSGSEKGFLGICLHPNFATSGELFIYYTRGTPTTRNRVSKFTMTGNTIAAGSEVVILDNIEATNGNHNGGTVAVGPDGKLYIAPGDSGTGGAKSQDLAAASPSRFNGKVLRMELDGSPAAGNPFLGDATKEPRIYAYGFRNPFRFSFRSSNGALYVADVGQGSREELDVVTSGNNYGWPTAEGTLGQAGCSGCIPPIFEYDHSIGSDIIGGLFVTSAVYPSPLAGKYILGDEVGNWVRFLDIDATNTVNGGLTNFGSANEGPVDFKLGPDGHVYYVAIHTGRVYRINAPPMGFNTLTPCRLIDTRNANGPLGGPAFSAGGSRTFTVTNACGVPLTARALAVNVAVTQPGSTGNLIIYPAGTTPPTTSAINFNTQRTRANNAVALLNATGAMTITCQIPSGNAHVIVDVSGYFE